MFFEESFRWTGRGRPLRSVLGLLLGIGLLPSTACDTIFDTEPYVPSEARVELAGARGTELDLITSDWFFRLEDGSDVELLEADTSTVTQPFSRDYPMSEPARFYVRVENSGDEGVDVTLRVSFDGDERYKRSRILEPTDFLEFNYLFNSP